MEKDLLEIKEKIFEVCNKYSIKNMTIYLQQERKIVLGKSEKIITNDVDLEIEL